MIINESNPINERTITLDNGSVIYKYKDKCYQRDKNDKEPKEISQSQYDNLVKQYHEKKDRELADKITKVGSWLINNMHPFSR